MNKLIFYILLIAGLITWLFGCVTVDKAINKVVATPKFTPEQTNLLAAKYNILFPTIEWVQEGAEKVDSSDYKNKIDEMEAAIQNGSNDLINLLNLIDSTGGENEKLKSVAAVLQSRIDSASMALALAKSGKIPCPKILKTDTAFKRVSADLVIAENRINELKMDNATKDVQIAAKAETIKEKEAEIKKLKEENNFWEGFKWGSIAAAAFLFLLSVFLKLRGFSPLGFVTKIFN